MSDFHADRLTGLGGSDLGAVLGLNPYRTPYQVWMEKTGRAEPFEGNLQTRFGTFAEQFVADEYSAITGNRVQKFNSMLRHPDAPLIGHVDRLVIPPGKQRAAHRLEIRTDRGLECKTAHALAASRNGGWGELGTDQVPEHYLVQCAAYMALTGCSFWDLAVLFGNSDFRVFHLERDFELEAALVEESSRWWRDHVLADVPPDPSSEAEARQRWSAHRPGSTVELDETAARDLRELARVKAEIREREKLEQEIRDRLIPRLADAEVVTFGGRTLATFKTNKFSQRTDWQGVAAELKPSSELIERHTKDVPGARVLRFAKEIAS